MKFRTSNGSKVLTRSGALGVLAALTAAGSPIGDDLRNHENYHVRRAVWVAEDMPIPEAVLVQKRDGSSGYDCSAKVELFKDLMPNHFARVSHHKAAQRKAQERNEAEVAKAEEHNAKARLLLAADLEKFDVLVDWLPIAKRELRKLGENPNSSQQKYNELSACCTEVDSWLRERCEVYVPEVFQPIAADDLAEWKSVVGESIYAHLFVSDPSVVDAIPTAS